MMKVETKVLVTMLLVLLVAVTLFGIAMTYLCNERGDIIDKWVEMYDDVNSQNKVLKFRLRTCNYDDTDCEDRLKECVANRNGNLEWHDLNSPECYRPAPYTHVLVAVELVDSRGNTKPAFITVGWRKNNEDWVFDCYETSDAYRPTHWARIPDNPTGQVGIKTHER